MMKIYVLRHGEAVSAEEVGGRDDARTLTDKGEEAARRAAEGMARIDVAPDRICTSPYPRAAQTAEITAEALGRKEALEECPELEPGADPGVIAGLLHDKGAEGHAVMIVGHNPDLELLVQYLISGTDQANITLKKGGLAVIEAERPIHQGCGRLVGLWSPKQLAKVAG